MLTKEREMDFVQIVPGIDLSELGRLALSSRPLQLHLGDAPPKYQDLGLALARRIENQDLSKRDFELLKQVLRGGDDDE